MVCSSILFILVLVVVCTPGYKYMICMIQGSDLTMAVIPNNSDNYLIMYF